jgi:hypothetical protein
MEETMNVASSTPYDPRMARLAETIEESRVAVAEFRNAMRFVNDGILQAEVTPVLQTAELVFEQHLVHPSPTIANDIANLLAAFNQLSLPGKDPDFGSLPGLKALRGARGNVREEFNEVLEIASSLGWKPDKPALPDIGGTEVPRNGLEAMLKTLVARVEAVEQILDHAVEPEGQRAPDRTTVQIALVSVFVRNLRVELALAKLEARVKEIVDLSVLSRAIENVTELTADFIATVHGMTAKMTVKLRQASELLRPSVREVANEFKTIVKKAASIFDLRNREEEFVDVPSEFDLATVYKLILSGRAPPASWQMSITKLIFSEYKLKLKDLSPLADLTALQILDLDNTPVNDLAPLANLRALRRLDLDGARVTDLAPLANLAALERLDLDRTLVSDLTPLANLTALKMLWLNGTQVTDLTPLSNLKALEWLDLRNTRVTNLEPLAGLTDLRSLWLDGTPVSDLAPLAKLENLDTIVVESDARRTRLVKTLQGSNLIVTVRR